MRELAPAALYPFELRPGCFRKQSLQVTSAIFLDQAAGLSCPHAARLQPKPASGASLRQCILSFISRVAKVATKVAISALILAYC